jgi:predicted nucleic acid-binding protein
MIADTTFLIDLQQERERGHVGSACRFLAANRSATIRITVVSVAEFAAGFTTNAEARFFLAPFPIIRLFPEAAYEAADIDRDLMRTGDRLGENDNVIAGIARYFGEPLISNDAAFRRVASLRVRSY